MENLVNDLIQAIQATQFCNHNSGVLSQEDGREYWSCSNCDHYEEL